VWVKKIGCFLSWGSFLLTLISLLKFKSKIADMFEFQLFGDQPLGWNIAGPKEVIKKVTRDQIIDYRNRTYVPQNIVVVVTGPIPHERVVTLVEKYFQFTNSGDLPKPEPFKPYKPQRKLIVHRKTEQAAFWLGTQAYDRYHKDRFALRVLRIILGGSMSSRLFMSVRERQGLCYYVGASIDDYADIGSFAAYAGVDLLRVNQALRAIEKEFALIAVEPVSSEELMRAKSYIKGKMVMSLEDSESVANMLAHQQLFYNRFYTLEEQKALIDAVSIEDIQRVAQDILKPENMTLALIGPFEEKDIEF
jgi:predicted Zn-dependent peptidase